MGVDAAMTIVANAIALGYLSGLAFVALIVVLSRGRG